MVCNHRAAVRALALVPLLAPLFASTGRAQDEPTAPASGFVYNDGVKLHYLDWGGTGSPLVFVTGLGVTAYAFSDIAPKLTTTNRVFAVTRRGVGDSDRPDTGYDLDTLTEDLKALLDSLGIQSAIFVGHSMGGWEITELAVQYPERVKALIYIDGTLDGGPAFQRMQAANPIVRPRTAEDVATREAARQWFERFFYGFWSPALEADFQSHLRNPQAITGPIGTSLRAQPDRQKPYARTRAPALALYQLSTIETRYAWFDSETPADTVEMAQRYLDEMVLPWQEESVARFRRERPDAVLQRLDGHHFLFITNEAEVLAAIREFLVDLP